MATFIDNLKRTMDNNGGKIPKSFIDAHLNHSKTMVTHARLTKNTRVCVITLTTGHEFVGYAQVVNAKNDVEALGQEIAYDNAADQIWAAFGSIAKVIQGDGDE